MFWTEGKAKIKVYNHERDFLLSEDVFIFAFALKEHFYFIIFFKIIN